MKYLCKLISPLYLQSVIFLIVASGLSFCWDSHTGHRTDSSLSVQTFLEVLILMRVEDRVVIVVNVDTEAAQCHAKITSTSSLKKAAAAMPVMTDDFFTCFNFI